MLQDTPQLSPVHTLGLGQINVNTSDPIWDLVLLLLKNDMCRKPMLFNSIAGTHNYAEEGPWMSMVDFLLLFCFCFSVCCVASWFPGFLASWFLGMRGWGSTVFFFPVCAVVCPVAKPVLNFARCMAA